MPKSECASTLKVLHLGHYAIDKMSLRARERVYWPGISKDIRSTYHHCQICAKFARTQQKETLQPIETPQAAWEQLGLDIFSLRNTQYLLVVDYFSQFSKKAEEYPFVEYNQTSQRYLHRDRHSQMHSLRWWHPIHITRVQRHCKNLGNTTQSHHPQIHSLMAKQSVLYRLSRTVSPRQWKGRRPAPSNFLIHHNTLEPQSTLTCRVTKL